jgi:hypothetical protein
LPAVTNDDAAVPGGLTLDRLPQVDEHVLDGMGRPRFGAYEGLPPRVHWGSIAAPHRLRPTVTAARLKKWVYAVAATEEILVATAVVAGGVAGTAFVMVTDLRTGEVIADTSRPGGSGPLNRVADTVGHGVSAVYKLPGTDYAYTQDGPGTPLRVRINVSRVRDALPVRRRPWVDIDFTLSPGSAPPLSVISEVRSKRLMATSTFKTSVQPSAGEVRIHRPGQVDTYSLDGGFGGYDYTNGHLPRLTAWRWAYTTGRLRDGRLFGLNLVSDFSGIEDRALENAVWLDDRLLHVAAPVRFDFDPENPDKPWRIRTLDGAIELRFDPMATHIEATNLGVIRSNFAQLTGRFTGRVVVAGQEIPIDGLAGVAEDQATLW